ncbi:MAG: ATP-binding cassette domain-containing protein [Candidatus Absconditabacteria bacterium]|nr:ATP-binding cassette domain-containing protein [Candidatus Absconditabacteria bacterium]MDD3868650.1 ATP-binding cassette domain-containing protein [Candidatus Absconditabacteria bacterium]MDD4714499.1 ATP-binding cassette domain-containing protein [Candidatus Absconditabacteria bacterium]
MNHLERTPLIAVKDLTRGYPEQTKPLFRKLNFELFKGDFTIVLGKSGAGKSTLVRFLIGELRPYKKTVYYKMDDLSTLSDDEIQRYRRNIGIVFQDYKLMDSLSIRDNIMYPLRLDGLSDTVIKKKYKEILQKLNIEDDERLSGKNVSGGEKQKVSIARALINNSEFIIADEPTGNLDWEYTQEIGDVLIEANGSGNTILLITHDIHLLNYIKSKTKVRIFQM